MNPLPSPHSTAPATATAPKDNILAEIIKTIGISAFLALFLRTFVWEFRYIPDNAVVRPHIFKKDRLTIDKWTYHFSEPQRGDIVVFNLDKQLKQHFSEEKTSYTSLIKRVVALPGDRVDIERGKVLINGQLLSEKYLIHPFRENRFKIARGGRVPYDRYLVLGDNYHKGEYRDHWGFVSRDDIVGKVTFRYWPLSRFGRIDK
jgi:signal peptidase I